MNLHGYKQKKKSMTEMLKRELSKKQDKQHPGKIRRLERAKNNCLTKIRELRMKQ